MLHFFTLKTKRNSMNVGLTATAGLMPSTTKTPNKKQHRRGTKLHRCKCKYSTASPICKVHIRREWCRDVITVLTQCSPGGKELEKSSKNMKKKKQQQQENWVRNTRRWKRGEKMERIKERRVLWRITVLVISLRKYPKANIKMRPLLFRRGELWRRVSQPLKLIFDLI